VPVGGYGPQVQYATFGKRFGALLLDGLIVALLYIPGFIYIVSGPKETYLCNSDLSSNTSGLLICERPTGSTWATAIALWLLALLLGCLYHALMTGSSGQTIGKRAVGIKVVDATTGGPVGFGKAFARALIQGATALICGLFWLLDHLWPLWDERKQALHDKAVGSIVVEV
jgi:uncharacterized RDD family membrane protein YckC